MLDYNIRKLKILIDFDLRNWGLGFWLHLDEAVGYKRAFEIIIGCFWLELIQDNENE